MFGFGKKKSGRETERQRAARERGLTERQFDEAKSVLFKDLHNMTGVGNVEMFGYPYDSMKITIFRDNGMINIKAVEIRCNSFMWQNRIKVELEIIRCKAKMTGE